MKPKKHPSYRFHKARNCAVVTILGKDHYLGEYDSPSSWEQYHRLIVESLATPVTPPPKECPAALTVTELIAAYWRFAKSYYIKDGKPTKEPSAIKLSLRFVRKLYGDLPATEFSPKKLTAVREAMIIHEITRQVNVVDEQTGKVHKKTKVVRTGMTRRSINKLISRIRRMFAWGVEQELIPVEVHAALLRVKGLKKGKTTAVESDKVRPVSEEAISKTLPHVPAMIRTMIEIQQLTGCRPQEVVQMRLLEIDRSGPVWEYRPHRYKTEHHNQDNESELDRVVYLGPKAQAILMPFLPESLDEYFFSPKRSEATRNASRRENRVTPMTPSQSARKPKGRKKAPLQNHYLVASYRQAIRRGCLAAGIPVWKPNQLRHSRLTEIRKQFGLEASRVCGGHREVGVTQIYAEQDHSLARKVMAEVG